MPVSKNYGLIKSTVLECILNFEHPSEIFFRQLVDGGKVEQGDWKAQIHQYMLEECIKKISFKYSGEKKSDDLYECYSELSASQWRDSHWWGAFSVAFKLLASNDEELTKVKNVAVEKLLLSASAKSFLLNIKKPNFWNAVILPYWRLNENPTLIYDDVYRLKKESMKTIELSRFLGNLKNKEKMVANQTVTAMLLKSFLEDLCKSSYSLALKVGQKDFLVKKVSEAKTHREFLLLVFLDCFDRCPWHTSYFGAKDNFVKNAIEFLKFLETLAHGKKQFTNDSFEAAWNFFLYLKNLILDGIRSIFVGIGISWKEEYDTGLNWFELRPYPFNSDKNEEEISECAKKLWEIRKNKMASENLGLLSEEWTKFVTFSKDLTNEEATIIEPYLARGLLEFSANDYISKLKITEDWVGKGLTKKVSQVLTHVIHSRKDTELNKVAVSLRKKSEAIVSEINDYAHNPFTIDQPATKHMIAFSYRFRLVTLT